MDRHVSWSGRPALGDGPWLSLPRLLDGLSPPALSYVAFRSGQVGTREPESLPGLICVALLFQKGSKGGGRPDEPAPLIVPLPRAKAREKAEVAAGRGPRASAGLPSQEGPWAAVVRGEGGQVWERRLASSPLLPRRCFLQEPFFWLERTAALANRSEGPWCVLRRLSRPLTCGWRVLPFVCRTRALISGSWCLLGKNLVFTLAIPWACCRPTFLLGRLWAS